MFAVYALGHAQCMVAAYAWSRAGWGGGARVCVYADVGGAQGCLGRGWAFICNATMQEAKGSVRRPG